MPNAPKKYTPSVEIPPRPVPQDAMPRHIAVIMDGNGRWAKGRGLPRTKGHEEGAKTVRSAVECCSAWGVEALTLYAFSSENWRRPKTEINALMLLLRAFLKREREELVRQNVRLLTIGDVEKLPFLVRRELKKCQDVTAACSGLKLVLALSYGGRDEIVRAARKIAESARAGRLKPEAVTEESFSALLDTAGLPDPDLLIRTAGERRISNFLLWQASYCEYYSSEVCWPDFGPRELCAAVKDYCGRRRKFGDVAE